MVGQKRFALCPFREINIIPPSELARGVIHFFRVMQILKKVKQERAQGGCLGTESR